MLSSLVLISIIGVLFLIYKWSTRNFDRFNGIGIKFVQPTPILGSNGFVLKGKTSFPERVLEYYRKFPEERCFGFFNFNRATFFIRDPILVKKLLVKDFHHFQDHSKFFGDENVDELLGNALFTLCGQRWRDMRLTLSPLFTGSKMRMMHSLIVKCAKQLVEFVKENERKNVNERPTYDAKTIFSKYSNDVIGTCAFGVECDSLRNPSNEFFLLGQDLLSFQSTKQVLKLMFASFLPSIAKLLKFEIIKKKTKQDFRYLVIETMKIRKENNIIRPDILNLLMKLTEDKSDYNDNSQVKDKSEEELKKLNAKKKTTWTETELMAQCLNFFIAGFDSASSLMEFMVYELAVNEEVQNRLLQEIQEIENGLEGKDLIYEAVNNMKFMDMVINETLRLWPPAVMTDRRCTQDYLFQNTLRMDERTNNSGNETEFYIREGDELWAPIYGFHMDGEYFPNPTKFDPDRFSEENIHRQNMDAFMPFGVGPRICIGMRFAILEVKILFYYLIKDFQILLSPETDQPLRMKRSLFKLTPENPIKVEFKSRR